MITLTRIKEATSEFIKVLRNGKNDVQTALQILPAGIDSKPVKNILGIHAETGNIDEPVILGYVLKSDATKEGETRLYANDSSGAEVFSIYLRNDGTCEFNGTQDFFTKFSPLNSAMIQLAKDINAELTKIASGIAVGGGAYTPKPIQIDISSAKTEKIKTD